ncbi:VCBS repeat-containing protein [Acidobacteria bacterium AB60]|nr:VCBS repeat-containing protein [Acidobacteria bacterium AB60]
MAFFPRSTALSLAALASASVCLALNPASFKSVTTIAGETAASVYAVDLNNDGITDLLQDTGQSPPGFTVSLGKGDGTFKPPVLYSVPSTSLIGTQPMATGDFNHDGKIDIAAVFGTQIAIWFGNGDGTFQSPKITNVALPSGFTFSEGTLQAADFNGDGKLDLAGWITNFTGNGSVPSTTAVYVFRGDGAGGFSNPRQVLSGPGFQPGFQTLIGDFDADGKADIAATYFVLDSEGATASTTVHVLYGNDDFTFQDTTPYIANGGLNLGAGDLNGDGLTDLFGIYGYAPNQQLATFYGTTSRTFNDYFMNTNATYGLGTASDGTNYNSQLVMGDFNGDGRMDLAAMSVDTTNYANDDVIIFLAQSSPGIFSSQAFQLGTTYIDQSAVVPGLFGGSFLKPDLAFSQSPNYASPPQNQPSYLVSEVNQASTGWFGPCYYPRTGQGFNVCAAGTVSGSTATFNAAVNSFGSLRKIELWVDGKKLSEQYHTWDRHGYFNYASTFAPGAHSGTFFAADVDNRLQRYDFTFTVGGASCSAPSTPGVNICTPVNNSTVSSPVSVLASANITGTLARMELWIDGVKFYTETNSTTLSISYPLGAGKHQFGVYAVNTAGTKWLGLSYATVP